LRFGRSLFAHTDAVLAHRLNPLARYDDYVFTIISAERIAHQ